MIFFPETCLKIDVPPKGVSPSCCHDSAMPAPLTDPLLRGTGGDGCCGDTFGKAAPPHSLWLVLNQNLM